MEILHLWLTSPVFYIIFIPFYLLSILFYRQMVKITYTTGDLKNHNATIGDLLGMFLPVINFLYAIVAFMEIVGDNIKKKQDELLEAQKQIKPPKVKRNYNKMFGIKK